MDTFVADLRKKYTVTIDETTLAKVTIDTGMDSHGPTDDPNTTSKRQH